MFVAGSGNVNYCQFNLVMFNAENYIERLSDIYGDNPRYVREQIIKAINSPYTYLSFTNDEITKTWNAFNDKFYPNN